MFSTWNLLDQFFSALSPRIVKIELAEIFWCHLFDHGDKSFWPDLRHGFVNKIQSVQFMMKILVNLIKNYSLLYLVW